MRLRLLLSPSLLFNVIAFCQQDTLHYPEEIHFSNLRQLTFGADNAEAYWSYDGKWIASASDDKTVKLWQVMK